MKIITAKPCAPTDEETLPQYQLSEKPSITIDEIPTPTSIVASQSETPDSLAAPTADTYYERPPPFLTAMVTMFPYLRRLLAWLSLAIAILACIPRLRATGLFVLLGSLPIAFINHCWFYSYPTNNDDPTTADEHPSRRDLYKPGRVSIFLDILFALFFTSVWILLMLHDIPRRARQYTLYDKVDYQTWSWRMAGPVCTAFTMVMACLCVHIHVLLAIVNCRIRASQRRKVAQETAEV